MNCAGPEGPSGTNWYPADWNFNENGEGEDDTQDSEVATRQGKGRLDGTGNGMERDNEKGNGKENGKAKVIVTNTPRRQGISRARGLQLHKTLYEVDSDTQGCPEREYYKPEESPTMSISWDDDCDSTVESQGE